MSRIQKKNPSWDFLPEKLTLKGEMSQITTRSEYNAHLKALKRFGAKTAVLNKKAKTPMSKWETAELVRTNKVYKKREERRVAELGEKEVTRGGQPTGIKRKEMGRIKEQPKTFPVYNPETMKKEEWDLFKKQMNTALDTGFDYKRAMNAQENYIKGLIRIGADPELIDMVRHVDPKLFAEVIDLDELADFDYIYSPDELEMRMENLKSAWNRVVSEREFIEEAVVDRKMLEIESDMAQGYTGRRMTTQKDAEWRQWEREHWSGRRSPRKRAKKK